MRQNVPFVPSHAAGRPNKFYRYFERYVRPIGRNGRLYMAGEHQKRG